MKWRSIGLCIGFSIMSMSKKCFCNWNILYTWIKYIIEKDVATFKKTSIKCTGMELYDMRTTLFTIEYMILAVVITNQGIKSAVGFFFGYNTTRRTVDYRF